MSGRSLASTLGTHPILSLSLARSTPVWSNPCHNTIRRACFKTLSLGCLKALKEGGLAGEPEQRRRIEAKLDKLRLDSDEILVCTKYLDFMNSAAKNM